MTNEDLNKVFAALEPIIEDEVQKRIKNLTTHVVYDGELVDSDVCDIDEDGIYVEIKAPLFFSDIGRSVDVNALRGAV